MNWNGMMVNMSDLGNQMGSMMKKGLDGQKAPASDPEADPFRRADTMLGGLFVSMGRGLGQTGKSITDLIAGSALGSAVGELYSGSMLDTAVSGVSKGFSATRDYINGNIETVKNWGGGVLDSLGVTDTFQRGKNFITGKGLKTNIEIAMEAYEQEMGRQTAVGAAFGEMARQDMAAQVAGLGAHGTKNVFDVNYVVSKTMGLSSQETMDAMKLIFGVASADELQKKLSSGEITMMDVLDKTGVSQNMNAMAGFANEYVDASQARAYKNYIAAEKAKQKQLQAQAEQENGLQKQVTVGYDNGFSRMMQKAGDWLNSWGTEASKPLNKAGQYLNENPDAALATCFGAAAVGTLLPFAVNTVPAWGLQAISAYSADKGVDIAFGAATNTAAYLVSEGRNFTAEGVLTNAVIGGATGFSANVVSNYFSQRAVAGAVNYISTGLTGAVGNVATQYANEASFADLNLSQVGWSGLTYGFGSYVGSTFSRGVSKFWGEALAPNMATTGPAVFGSWMIDIYDRNRNNDRGSNR